MRLTNAHSVATVWSGPSGCGWLLIWCLHGRLLSLALGDVAAGLNVGDKPGECSLGLPLPHGRLASAGVGGRDPPPRAVVCSKS